MNGNHVSMPKIESNVYIDEAGDLGIGKGTRWFVLSAVIVDKSEERNIRSVMDRIKTRLNVREIHLRKIQDYYKRALIVQELNETAFTYINVIVDTNKFDVTKIPTSIIAYNYICKYLLQRVSWYLDSTNRIGNIVLSARGTSRDGELIEYIKEKLLPYPGNSIYSFTINSICAKTPASWDLLQLADVCATTTFLGHEKNGWGFTTPCYSYVLASHLYRHNSRINSYGIKYFADDMKPQADEIKCLRACHIK